MDSKSDRTKRFNLASAWPLALLFVIGLCALSFYGGISYQKGKTTTTSASANSTGPGSSTGLGGGGGGRRFNGQRPTIGQVTAISASSITVTPSNGGAAVTLAITSSTTITNNGQAASASDIQTGQTVLVSKSTSDATQAARILINPSFGGGGGAAPTSSSGI